MDGWIKLHRKIMDWEWYHDSQMVHLFTHLIMMAQHQPTRFRGVKLERSQLLTGRKALSEQTGISEQSIRRCLYLLKSTSELTIKPTNKYSILTVVNYETYQPTKDEANQQTPSQPTNNQPTTNQQLTTCKNDKKDKKEKKTTNNHPRDLAEMMDYCRTQLHWNISDDSARSIWNYYCPPGGDEVWRDRKGGLVVDWHKRMVTCRKNDTTPQREDPEETLKRLQAKGYC